MSVEVKSSPAQAQKSNLPKKGKDLKYLRDRDREMVRGIFRFYEVPGGNMSFSFRKYREDEIETFSLNDGEIYTLPRGVAHHLSNNCWYPEYTYKQGDDLKNVAMITKKRRRCSFDPLDFMDIDDLNELKPGNIETVTILK